MPTRKTKTNKDQRVTGDPNVPAKLTCPVMTHGYPRTRLFHLLDQARKQPVVWITGPAGAGKTTLATTYLVARSLSAVWYRIDAGDGDIASFFYYMGVAIKVAAPRNKKALPLFTREYLSGLPAFTANYFRELFARMKRPGVLVLDNFEDVADSAALQAVLRQALDEIPTDINVIVLSRVDPPAALMRARASGRIACIGWEDLRLTRDESAGILELRHQQQPLTELLTESLHRMTQGWATGIVLASERLMRNRNAVALNETIPVAITQEVFDYFASEIFSLSSESVQSFLMATGFLPKVSVSVAQAQAQTENAQEILDGLSDRNLFTVRHADGSYEYHPLFRAFLLARANQVYSPEQVRELQKRAAELLADNGEVDSAVDLLQQAAEWKLAIQVMLRHASRVYVQGRTQTLETWIRKLPESCRNDEPWLLYWLGMCRLAYAPAQARVHLEDAYAGFERGGDAAPLYLTWSGLIDSIVLERNDFSPMRKWLELYPKLGEGRTPPPPDIEATSKASYVTALINHRFDHPDLPKYVSQIEALLKKETNEDRRFLWILTLTPYYLWCGDLGNTARLTQNLAPSAHDSGAKPLTRLCWYVWNILEAGATGAAAEAERLMHAGLALAEMSGIHAFDMQMQGYAILGLVSVGDVKSAQAVLTRMLSIPQRGMIADAFRSHFTSIVDLHRGDMARAATNGKAASTLSKSAGLFVGEVSHTLELGYVYAHQGQLDRAQAIVDEMRTKAESMGSKTYISYVAFCEANICRLRGDSAETLRALRESLARASEVGCILAMYCPRDDAARLLAMALDAGIEPEYSRGVIQKMRLTPPSDLLSPHWPWPVKIQTLGRFAVIKDGVTLALGTRSGKKPLELLRALTMFGGRDVSVTKLAQLLWPEADGDLAHQSMEVTLHRLRKLIGEQCIVREENLLSLNSEYVWLDSLAFEGWAEQVESAQIPPEQLVQVMSAAYRGTFLPEVEAPAAIIQRERLRAKFVRALSRLGQSLEDSLRFEDAVTCYEQALEREPLVEELHHRLIECHRRRNSRGDAMTASRRCQSTLRAALGTEPSPALKKIIAELQR